MKRDIDILNEIQHELHPDQPKLTPSFRSSLSVVKLLFEIFEALTAFLFLRIATIIVFFGGIFLSYDYFGMYRQADTNHYIIYFIILFIYLLVMYRGMKREGAEEFLKNVTTYNHYSWVFGESITRLLFAGLFYLLIFMCLIVVVVLVLNTLSNQ